MSSTGDRGGGGGSEASLPSSSRRPDAPEQRNVALADTLPARSSGPAADSTLPPSVLIAPSLAERPVDAHADTLRPSGHVDPYGETLAPAGSAAAQGQTQPPESSGLAGTLGPDSAVNPHGETLGSPVVSVGDISRLHSDYPVARWDRYEFQKKLGQGGMGAVYKARDRRLGRDVALKFIRGGDPNLVMRFLQEARAQARIDHPHVCKVYEVGEVEGKAYIAMQFVDGQSLHRAAKELSLTEKVLLMRQVAEAMHEAHRLGIIHRDLKPDNIMVERLTDGTMSPVVMDFGLAREAGDNRGLTESGAVMGTPAYMAPEQARGDVRTLDRRADVYSLGATLYDLIAGVPPFDAQSVVDVLLQVMNEDAVPLRTRLPSVPADLETIVMKCLRKEPGARYDSAKALADDLQRYIDGEPIQGRRESVIGRVRRRAKKNLALVFVSAVSLVLVAGFAVQWVRVQLSAKRERERAAELVKLERQLGQDIKEMEWFLRSAYQLPLHDITPQLAIVRARMAAMDSQRAALRGDDGGRIDYAIGRGHLALHEPAEALRHLKQAKARGLDIPELHYALGRALGERFQQALEEARRQGDKSWVEKRRKELEAEYLQPAVKELEKSRGGTLDSPEYLEGLIAFYRKQYDVALEKAKIAFAKYPWLYESKVLEGDVNLSIGTELCDEGKYDSGLNLIDESSARYIEAVHVARSDVEVHESLTESYMRKSHALFSQGKNVEPELNKIKEGANSIISVNSIRPYGYIKRAYAHFWIGFIKGASAQDPRGDFLASIDNSNKALSFEVNNAYANDMLGNGNYWYGVYEKDNGRDPLPRWKYADSAFQAAIRAENQFPWAHNDYGLLQQGRGNYLARQGADWRPELLESVKNFQRSIEADPSYIAPYINAIESYYFIVDLLTASHENAESAVKDAMAMYRSARSVNKNVVLIHYNMANMLMRYMEYLIAAGLNVDFYFGEIQHLIDELQGIENNGLFATVVRMKFGVVKMSLPDQSLISLGNIVKELQLVAEECRKNDGNAGRCDSILASAHALIAERIGYDNPAAARHIESALFFSGRAIAVNPGESEAIQVQVRASLAKLQGRTKKLVITDVDSVIKLAKKALELRPYEGHNHGNLARLLRLRAELSPQSRVTDAQQAKAHFQQAIQRSPRLAETYRKPLQEVEALLVQQGGGK